MIKRLVVLISVGVLAACASSTTVLVVTIDQNSILKPSAQKEPFPDAVKVLDLRREASLKRTAMGVSLGSIVLSPSELKLVKSLVLEALYDTYGAAVPSKHPTVYCGIKTFMIDTPATPFYFDVTAQIHLLLRVNGQEEMVSGRSVERTWLHPGESIISRVTTNALQQVSSSIKEALPKLLASSAI